MASQKFDQSPANKTVIQKLAEYIVATRDKSLSDEVFAAGCKCVADLFGVAAAGVNDPGVKAVRDAALRLYSSGNVPIWFTNESGTVIAAATANAAAAASKDADDGHSQSRGHPGSLIIPTACSIAYERGIHDWKVIITAIEIGYEVGIRVGAARKTYGNTGTWGPAAVVATAAALYKTPLEVIEHALGIALETAPNMAFHSGRAKTPIPEACDVKEGIVEAVRTGLTALEEATAGRTGARNLLNSTILYHFPEVLDFSSKPFICLGYLKPYAVCRHGHAAVEAFVALVRKHKLDVHEIKAAEIETNHWATTTPNKTDPENVIGIQYSVPYHSALAAISGFQVLLPVTEESLGLKSVQELAKKITMKLNTEFDRIPPEEPPARATIWIGDDKFQSDVEPPRGGVSNPVSWPEIQKKIDALISPTASDSQRATMGAALQQAREGNLSALEHCVTNWA